MRAALALLGMFAAIGMAGSAYADPEINGGSDADGAGFLAALAAVGITYTNPDQAVASAKTVCRLAEGGRSGPEVVALLMSRNSALTPEHAGQFVALAERSYCPGRLAPGDAG